MKKPTPFGKYFLLERINVGGMAEVFRAKAFGVEGFERLVAVKRILSNIAEDKEFIRMFIEEAKLSVQLNHANIAQIFDLGVVDGAYYIALEHVHGRDLRGIFDRCRQLGSTMPVAQACFVVMKLCEGLDYAHNKRDQSGKELSLVHRDVSPQNVLVSFEGEVKIIDFGIAKAAGKGSKTQAGILKGKFGYMSPEQVRGLPVDRRSDVFSCGIVLYELLTGERLFVGESDFSTLEKVRNVEILPPSTYNRKIPEELERIVLKALSKDVEDRYQNAIDLHDELQAFVYTAGEFYSRKDLAGWMKKTFSKEIEEETTKLESYRQLKAPTAEEEEAAPPPPPRSARRSAVMPAVNGPPTPPPPIKPPPTPARVSQQMAAASSGPVPTGPRRKDDTGELSWDDDELETKIYDNPEDEKAKASRSNRALPLQPPAAAVSQQMAAASAAALPPPPGSSNPDLSSLTSTAKGWESAPTGASPSPASTINGIGFANGRAPKLASGSHNEQLGAGAAADDPRELYDGDGLEPMQAPAMGGPIAVPVSGQLGAEEHAFDPLASSGPVAAHREGGRKAIMMMVIGGAAIAAISVAVVMIVNNNNNDRGSAPERPPAPVAVTPQPPAPPPPPQPAVVADQATGFDLYVVPAGVMQWRLDGEARTDRLPSRIRGITPGSHVVQIDGPPGFLSQTQKVEVAAGKADRLNIMLEAVQGIYGVFESDPPGATVSLIVDGKRTELGSSPLKAPLDPNHSYAVLFEKPGYVALNRPVEISGALEQKVAVTLEKAPVASNNPPPRPNPPRPNPPRPDPPKIDPPKIDPPKVDPPKTGPPVAVALGSKPSCEIFIDGASTGKYTPQPGIMLTPGKHKVTLVNNDYGIKETFQIDVDATKPNRWIKDLSDRLPTPK